MEPTLIESAADDVGDAAQKVGIRGRTNDDQFVAASAGHRVDRGAQSLR